MSFDEERGKSDVKNLEDLNKYGLDFAFVCVPTPMGKDGRCDTSIVEEVVRRIKAKTIIIESTIAPGTTEKLEKETGKNILFTPEYFGETKNHPLSSLNMRNFFIIGGRPEVRIRLVRLYKDIFQAHIKFGLYDSRTAEVIKYMENSFLGTKLIFCEEFARICDAFKVDYYQVREGWLMDPRINPSHTFPNKDGTPGFGGKCLPKDISAIIKASEKAGHNPEFLKAMFEYNKKLRKQIKD
ncbi:MAG TPA: hypothetical protein VMZ91_11480 [Candidatus Paceibacterota bacterium]|nr:hypothetical protein [Candidatus Paceibacterota bacterium]